MLLLRLRQPLPTICKPLSLDAHTIREELQYFKVAKVALYNNPTRFGIRR